ncbi:MAG TPA: ElyC/SanA/YdcF family protein [Verrucomicrobiae bacterium]|nr:ElyC/SanA/YdcF family protein [Verrucomicrobiae bacterium]
MKRWLGIFGTVLIVIVSAVVIGLIAYVQTAHIDLIRASEQDVTTTTVAMVLGASVNPDGSPSDALADRVITAAELYHKGTVSKLLLTGDDGAFHGDEVDAMKALALREGVSSTDILIDGHGYRTYESCKRAMDTIGVTSTVIITQRFHLARALYLCEHFGLQVQGLSADRQPYQHFWLFTVRDFLASAKAWWDVNIMAPQSPVK